jgi:predicted O-methyltransferase YrrM
MQRSSFPTLGAIEILRCLVRALDAGFRTWARSTAAADLTGFQDAWAVAGSIPGWLHEEHAAVLWAVITEEHLSTIVEIGSYLGRSTVMLGLAAKRLGDPSATVVAIDPHTGDRQQLERLGLDALPTLELFRLHITGAGLSDTVDTQVARSDEVAISWTRSIDLLYIDGWHSYDAVRADARHFARLLAPRGLVCFDDFAEYAEVRRGVVDSCAELGLTLYGTVFGQAWAGRPRRPPVSVARAIRVTRMSPVGSGEALHSLRRWISKTSRRHV